MQIRVTKQTHTITETIKRKKVEREEIKFYSFIDIASSPRSLLEPTRASLSMRVWDTRDNWKVRGPWEGIIIKLLASLGNELKEACSEMVSGTEARQQLFRDAWSE